MTGSDKTVGTQMFVENINQYIKTKVVGIFYTSTMNKDKSIEKPLKCIRLLCFKHCY